MMHETADAVDIGYRVGRPKHHYVMIFRASRRGLAKRVELRAEDSGPAIELAIADRARRTIDILENGQFLCRISRDPGAGDS